jgi:DNA-binding MarR family transcriptional regulator
LVRVGPDYEREWPGASASATECVLNAYLLASRIERASHTWLREQGVPSLAAFNVLTVLHGAGQALRPSVISDRLMVTRGTLTGILDTLERAGFAERRTDRVDGRMRLVRLTRRGRRAVDELLPRVHRAEQRVVEALDEEERAALLASLARMQVAAESLTF